MKDKVHCQCYHSDQVEHGFMAGIERANCNALVGKDGDKHCIGPGIIDGISMGGADMGSIYLVDGHWGEEEEDPQWDMAEYEQLGCTSYYDTGFERRMPDVRYELGGDGFDPSKCNNGCLERGYKYFGKLV